MHSGAGLLGTQMRRYLNPQQTRESDSWRLVHERHGHLNFHAVHLPYWFPRSSALHQISSPQPPATRPWRPSCDFRPARYPRAMAGQQSTVSRPLTYQIPTPPLSQSHICIRTPATSSVTRIAICKSLVRVAMANRRPRLRHRNNRAFHKWNVPQKRSSGTAMVRPSPRQVVSLVSWDYRVSYP